MPTLLTIACEVDLPGGRFPHTVAITESELVLIAKTECARIYRVPSSHVHVGEIVATAKPDEEKIGLQ
jgi:hypothetical protein